MSIWSSAVKLIGKAAKVASFIPGPVGVVGRGVAIGTSVLGAGGKAKALARGAGAIAGGLRSLPGKGLVGLAGGVAGGMIGGNFGGGGGGGPGYQIINGHCVRTDRCGNPVGYTLDKHGKLRRKKRMNPLNPRAARRAIRRVKAVHKICKSIEKQLPKVHVKSAPRAFGKRKH